jgi:hypothetical protein
MSKKPSDESRRPAAYETEGDLQKQQRVPRFLSDDDIVSRNDRPRRGIQGVGSERGGKEPKFVSDDDIVRRAA